jgi:hypothetical protein
MHKLYIRIHGNSSSIKKLCFFFFAIGLLGIQYDVKAQLREQSLLNKDQISIQSPNVASLGLFGEVPVSLFTGLPNIEVPLYVFHEGQISVPIKLNYHASGFRPDVHPGWVGMGWALSAGGMISRKVNGKPDDYDSYDNTAATSILDPGDIYSSRSGYYYNRTLLDPSNWNQLSYLRDLTGNDVDKRIIGSRKDTEPDEFSFSLPNASGKFYLDMDGSWKVDCDRAVKVTFNNLFIPVPFTPIKESIKENFGYLKTFSGFTITDIDGTQYVYGGSSDFIEYSIDFIDQNKDFWQADSWYLKQIIEPSGKSVSFEYDRGPYIDQLMMTLSQNFGTGASSSGFWQPPCGLNFGSFQETYAGKLISPLYLKRIKGMTGSVLFNKALSAELDFGTDYYSYVPGATIARDIYGNIWETLVNSHQLDDSHNKIFSILHQDEVDHGGVSPSAPANFRSLEYAYYYARRLEWYKLDQIQILNSKADIIKSFKFDYDPIPDKRLTLTSVKEGSPDGTFLTPYLFFYNPIDPNVPYFSGKIDHWGFYNGLNSDLGELSTNPSRYYNSRSSNGTYAQQGVLNKMTYPTGGYTEFEYESNHAGKQTQLNRSEPLLSYNGDVGGLRIKKIRSNDLVDATQDKENEYFYVDEFRNSANLSLLNSSGILGGQALYLLQNFQVPIAGSTTGYYLKNQFNSLSHLPGSNNSQGSQIGYSQVVEKRKDNSYTIFYYTNFDNGHLDEPVTTLNLQSTPYEPYTSLENERGKLYKEEVYTPNDILIHKKETEYLALDKTNQYAKSIRARSLSLCADGNDRYAEATAYKNYTYSYFPVKETETSFDLSGTRAVVNVRNYTYNDHRLLATESFLNSDQKLNLLQNYYSFDRIGIQPYQDMTVKNIVSSIVEQDVSVDNTLQSRTKTEYNYGLSPNPDLILPNLITTQDHNQPVETRLRFYRYDDRGNILSYSKENGIKMNYIWGYGKNLPVAEIRNTDYSVIENVLGAQNLDAFSNYIESPLGVIVPTSSFLDPLRTDVSLKDAQMTTYTYTPLTGMLSQTDAKQMTTHYEYDGFLRLKNVRDNDNHIVKSYDYYYHPPYYYNDVVLRSFTKQTCPNGYTGETVSYYVPANTFSSIISKDDANAIANHDIDVHGQAYANAQGRCKPPSVTMDYGYSPLKYEICAFTSQQIPIRSIIAYQRMLTINSPVSDNRLYLDEYLTDPVPTGYYVPQFSTQVPTIYTYIENGYIIYSNQCGQNDPVLLSHSSTNSIIALCTASGLQTQAAFVNDPNQPLTVGTQVYSEYSHTTPFPDGNYLKDGVIYIVSGGTITSTTGCSVH